MERLITVKDIRERYGCTSPTARKYLRQITPHMENPLAATLTAFTEWEAGRTVGKPAKNKKAERVHVPRERKG